MTVLSGTRVTRPRQKPRTSTAPTDVPIWVPGYGRVNWTTLQIEVYAEHLARHHRPARSPIGIRWVFGFLPIPYVRQVHCRHCGQQWICDEGAWADRWQTGLHRGVR